MRVAPFALAASLLLSGVLHANDVTDGEALVKQNDCLSCHQPTHKVVGPAYIDVAKKYKGDAGAVARLVKKVKAGGSGNWGAVPMAAHPNVSDADLTKMVKWVLAGAPMTAAPVPTAAPTVAAAPAAAASAGAAAAAPAPVKKRKHKNYVEGEKSAEISWATDEDVLKLMKEQDCFGCHQPVNRLGDPDEKPWPSFAKIEAKYKKGAPMQALVAKVHDGQGALKFGAIPHPVYDYLPPEAVQASIQFILDGKYAKEAPAAVDLSKMGGEEWMKTRSDCFTCHSVNAKIVGPAYKDVAKKYAGASDAQVKILVAKVKAGGSGNWGNVPMAAHPSAPDEMLEKAVRWVLSQK
jgi:cytochrome c